MHSLLFQVSEYRTRISVNSFFYVLRSIPVIRHLFRGDSYGFRNLKNFLIRLGFFGSFLSDLLGRIFGMLVTFLMAMVLTKVWDLSSRDTGTMVFLWYLMNWSTNFHLYESKYTLGIFDKLFYVEVERLERVLFSTEVLENSLLTVLAFFLLSLVFVPELAELSLLLGIGIFALMSLGNFLQLKLCERGTWKEKRPLWTWLMKYPVTVGMIIFAIKTGADFSGWTLRLIWVVVLLLGGLSFFYLMNYSRYSELFYSFPSEDKMPDSSMEKIQRESVALKEKDMEKDAVKKKSLKGYPLLNELFFRRHRRMIFRPILVKCIVLAVIFVAAMGFMHFPPLHEEDVMEGGRELFAALPRLLPFLGYVGFYQSSISKIMFINCDQSFLQYGFYRRPKDLLEMFVLRLKKILQWNAMLLLVFFVGLFMTTAYLGIPMRELWWIYLEVFALYIFFSVHTLTVYYLFQPYTQDLSVKSFPYQVINGLVYFLCYLFVMTEEFKGAWIAPTFVFISFVYSVLSLVLVVRRAPKTFVVKKES